MKRLLLSAAMTMSGCFGDGCVARGGRVSTPRGLINIEDLKVGDEVMVVDPLGRAVAVSPITFIRSAQRECGVISFDSGSIQLTSDHPVFDPMTGTFEPAGDWFLGKRTQLLQLQGDGLVVIEVTGVQAFSRVETVFDLTVEHAWHTFVSDGVVVHNKPIIRTCPLPDGGEYITYRSDPTCSCADGKQSNWGCEGEPLVAVCFGCRADAGFDDAGTNDGGP